MTNTNPPGFAAARKVAVAHDGEEGEAARSSRAGFDAVKAAIEYGGALYDEATSEDLNAAFDYIITLIADAVFLFSRKSFNTSAFLAITVIEETAKAHVAIYRKDKVPNKGRDPLRDHKAKHAMAVLPTVFMGNRLMETLGKDVCERLQHEAETSGFTTTREAALYCSRHHGRFITPRVAVPSVRSRELLLLAIETLDDALAGYTNHTILEGKHLSKLFNQVAQTKL